MTIEQNLSLEGVERVPLREFAEKAYLDYSMAVILDRALPHLADGLKPVQRRIVYAMSELGLNAASKPKKSARTVGDVLGKFHPHGDSACYEAMVLMAQPFSYRYPLIDGQGNWGSQDDPKSFAAMRYTESRLSPYAQLLLAELDHGTVEWVPNFDGTLTEPSLLPAQVPNVLLNGSSGIAVGMATDIPPHNISEVISALIHLLENKDATLADMLSFIKGPDFPTGAEIITPGSELQEMYRKGNGSVRVRATYVSEDESVVINSLPYQISGARIVEQIAAQMQAKKLPMVVDVRDEGDHEQPTRIVVVLRSNRVDTDGLMSHLFATTDLEHSYRVNMNMIGIDGRPQVKNLLMVLQEWLVFRMQTTKRRLEHRLSKVEQRLHLLDGLLIAYLNLDEVIRIIRYEDEPKLSLMKQFSLSELQAEAILDTKLRHLAKLEEQKIRAEQNELTLEQTKLLKILNSAAQLRKLMMQELTEVLKTHGEPRRSALMAREQAQVLKTIEAVVSEPVTVILSDKGWVRVAKSLEVDLDKLSFRAGDRLLMVAQGKSNLPAVFLDSTGRSYSLSVQTLPSIRTQGEPLSGKLTVPDGAQFVSVMMNDESAQYLLAGSHGYGFIVPFAELISKNRAGKFIFKVSDGTKILPPIYVTNAEQEYLAALTNEGYLLIFKVNELPVLPKGKGNKMIQLPKNSAETLCAVALINDNDHLEVVTASRTYVLKANDWIHYVGERGRRGKKLPRGLRQCVQMNRISGRA